MSISCSCSDDYDWYYSFSVHRCSANTSGKCYGCGKPVAIGEEVHHILSYEIDEDGDETDSEVLGRVCDQCMDMYCNLTDSPIHGGFGYCLYASESFIKEAHQKYLKTLPPNHILTRRRKTL